MYNKDNSWLPGNNITALEMDNYGNLWIGTRNGNGLAKFDGTNWRAYLPVNSQVPDEIIHSIVFDSNNAMWFSSGQGTLARVEGLSVSNEPVWTFYDAEDYSEITNIYNPDGIAALAMDSTDCLWMRKLEGDCLASFDGDSFERHTSSGLYYGLGRSLAIDQNNHIWVDIDGPCNLAKFDGTDWELIEPDIPGHPESMINYSHIVSLAFNSDNILWIGTIYQGSLREAMGIIRFDGSDWSTCLEGREISSSLDFSDNGNVWAGDNNNLVSSDGMSQIVFSPSNTGLPGNDIAAIEIDNDGNSWIGIDGGGVAVYNEKGVITGKNLSLSGHLFCESGDAPLNESVVELYRMGSMDYIQQLILSGTNAYEFTELEYGLYTVKVTPDEISYPETLPTWLGYELTRSAATYVSLSNNITDQDITVIQRPPEGIGTGTVAGTLTVDKTGKKRSTIKLSVTEGTPISECFVYLLDPGDQTVEAFDITSPEGEFVFSKLEEGVYMFNVDFKGMPMDVSNPLLEISSTNDTLMITAFTGSEIIGIEVEEITGIETLLKRNTKVYPVPVREHLIIDFGNDHTDLNVLGFFDS